MRRLPDHKIEMIKRWHADNPSWSPGKIARLAGCAEETARCYIVPGYGALVAARLKESRAKRKNGRVGRPPKPFDAVPKLDNVPGETREQREARMRVLVARDALFDPLRDGKPQHVANHFGDPPPGRRELLDQWARANPRRTNSIT